MSSKASTQQEALLVQHMCRQAQHSVGMVVRGAGISCTQGAALLMCPPYDGKTSQKL